MKNELTLVSLFAGAGGLDIGLEKAGFTSVVVNELQKHACETLRQNKVLSSLSKDKFDHWFNEQLKQRCHGNVSDKYSEVLRKRLKNSAGNRAFLQNSEIIEGDIRAISSEQFLNAAGKSSGEITLIAGGPPCQPFSRAGKRETVEVEDGRLFLEFVRVVNDCRPRWFLFENVKGLAQSKTTVPYLFCRECKNQSVVSFDNRAVALQNIFSSNCNSCDSSQTEVKTLDVRGGSLEIILNEFESIGYRCHHRILNAADFGVAQSRERLFIVGSRDDEPFSWPKPTHFEDDQANIKNSEQLAFFPDKSLGRSPWLTVKDVLWKDGHPEFGPLDYRKAVIWVKNVVRPHDEPVTWSLNRPSPTVGAHQAAKLAIAPNGVPKEQLLRQQWHTKGKRQGDMPPVFVDHAMLSDQELLELQTFPPYWYLYGTRMERAFQIGNAVPPTLAMVVGKSIARACANKIILSGKTTLEEVVA
jgi:DNA (cytosine-5)-methyltransferase 1